MQLSEFEMLVEQAGDGAGDPEVWVHVVDTGAEARVTDVSFDPEVGFIIEAAVE